MTFDTLKNITIVILAVIVLLLANIPCGHAATEAEEDFARSETYWLSLNIYHEARGESPYGMLLVAFVTLDRQMDGRWGDSIKEVVTSPSQFSWYNDGKSDIPTNEKSWETVKRVAMFAQMVYSTFSNQINLTHYHKNTINPYWSWEMERAMTVGKHIFYREIKNG